MHAIFHSKTTVYRKGSDAHSSSFCPCMFRKVKNGIIDRRYDTNRKGFQIILPLRLESGHSLKTYALETFYAKPVEQLYTCYSKQRQISIECNI